MSESRRELTEEERAWNAIATRQVLEGNGLNKELALLIAKEVTDCVRVVPVSSEPECGKPDGHGTPEHLARTGGQPCVREPGHAPPCQGHSRFVAYPDERVSARPVVEASGERIACPKCGANTGHYDLRGELEAALAHAASSRVGASGEREAMEAAWARFLEDNDPEPTMAWVHLAFQTAWKARGVAASSRVPDEAAPNAHDCTSWKRDHDAVLVCPDCGRHPGDDLEDRDDVPADFRAEMRLALDEAWATASRVPSAPGDVVQRQAVLLGIGAEYDGKPLDARKLTLFYPSSSAPEQVERLAKVIHADDCRQEGKDGPDFWHRLTEGERDEYRSNARAVLDAVSGPPDQRVFRGVGELEREGYIDPSGPPESDERQVAIDRAVGSIQSTENVNGPSYAEALRLALIILLPFATVDGAAGPPTKEER